MAKPDINKNSKPEWRVIIDILEKVDIVLLNRLIRRMIYHLYSLDIKGIPELVSNSNHTSRGKTSSIHYNQTYSNMPNPKIDLESLRNFTDKVFQIAEDNIPDSEITNQIKIWMSQEKSRFLSIAFENQNIPLSEAKDVLNRFMRIPKGETYISPDDFVNIRVSLIRRFLSSNLNYINIAKFFITVKDFYEILKRIIGPSKSIGKLGGKSAGLILGYEIIKSEKQKYEELKDIKIPKSWYISSDTIMEFIHNNALEEITSLKYLDIEEVRAGYPFLQQIFKNSIFPSELVEQLTKFLSELGEKPIIVRSSSLLEDSFEASFSGKYKSLFLANRGTIEERVLSLLDAISEIFASIFGPDPIEYRKEKGLIDFQEEMGILIQEVVGNKIGKYFFPTYAGVAFSHNEFSWSPRVKREDGVVRMVAGLGTRAVDRIGDDYPFLASPGKPGISVNISYEEIIKYSQKRIDVINLEKNVFETVELKNLLNDFSDDIPGIMDIISLDKGGTLIPPTGIIPDNGDFVLTFQNLIKKGAFLKQIKRVLSVLKTAFGSPVDVEFASDGNNIYILQCRPQIKSGIELNTITFTKPDHDKIIFRSTKFVTSGILSDINYLVYVDPEKYSLLNTDTDMKNVATVISNINKKLKKKDFILIGPGRWGSRGDIKLGVPVTYSDIFNTSMLIELSVEKNGYKPELSFGTHFFQDLVESGIKYLPIYLYEDNSYLKTELFFESPNRLKEIISDTMNLENVVKVIKASDIRNGRTISVVMDSDAEEAVGFIS